MKRIFTFLLLSAILFANSGCKKTANVSAAPWTASFNGSQKSGNYYKIWYTQSDDKGLIMYLGENQSGGVPYIQITLEGDYVNDLTPGTYNLSGGLNEAAYLDGTNIYSTEASNIGTLKITQFNLATKKMSGTFSFNLTNINNSSQTISVTNGSFQDLTIELM